VRDAHAGIAERLPTLVPTIERELEMVAAQLRPWQAPL
jgi:hypothetical protein